MNARTEIRFMTRDFSKDSPHTMWRYAPLLPVRDSAAIVSLGEGMTPLVRTRRLGFENLWIKDEGRNPTGSYEARGASCAVSLAVERGIGELSGSSAALAAYAAAAGIQARIDPGVGRQDWIQCRCFGAAEGTAAVHPPGWLEGIRTIGYELAEQFDWELPDAVFCPDDLAGIAQAFDELEALGWIGPRRPKMLPVPFRDFRETIDGAIELASKEGILAAPETAACIAALRELVAARSLKRDDRIVICNPTSGLKYLEAYATRFARTGKSEEDKLGGLVTPR